MKKIINGKMYNTATASLVGGIVRGYPGDFRYFAEDLYRKNNGEFFLYGEGGPLSEYRVSDGTNEWTGSWTIRKMTDDEARAWAEKNCTTEEYIAVFGEPEA